MLDQIACQLGCDGDDRAEEARVAGSHKHTANDAGGRGVAALDRGGGQQYLAHQRGPRRPGPAARARRPQECAGNPRRRGAARIPAAARRHRRPGRPTSTPGHVWSRGSADEPSLGRLRYPGVVNAACGRAKPRPVAARQRIGGHAMRDYAEQHGERDDGDCGPGHRLADVLQCNQGEYHRCQAAGTEPADECDGRAAEPFTGQRDRYRGHPDHRQAEHGVQHGLPGQALERRYDSDGAERQPDQQRHQSPPVSSTNGTSRSLRRPPVAPKASPPANAAMKPLPCSASAQA